MSSTSKCRLCGSGWKISRCWPNISCAAMPRRPKEDRLHSPEGPGGDAAVFLAGKRPGVGKRHRTGGGGGERPADQTQRLAFCDCRGAAELESCPWRNWSASTSPTSWLPKAATSPTSPRFCASTAPRCTENQEIRPGVLNNIDSCTLQCPSRCSVPRVPAYTTTPACCMLHQAEPARIETHIGLQHCRGAGCLMGFSATLEKLDRQNIALCDSCHLLLTDYLRDQGLLPPLKWYAETHAADASTPIRG